MQSSISRGSTWIFWPLIPKPGTLDQTWYVLGLDSESYRSRSPVSPILSALGSRRAPWIPLQKGDSARPSSRRCAGWTSRAWTRQSTWSASCRSAFDPRHDMRGQRLRLALDQNFPVLILNAATLVPEVEIAPTHKVDPRLSDLDDRRLLIALYQLG